MRHRTSGIVLGLSLQFLLRAQAPAQFEAASVKVNQSGASQAAMQMSGGRLTVANAPLRRIAGTAFGLSEDRIDYLLTGPSWMATERYDISATFAAGTPPSAVLAMLRELLQARFGMSFHRETRDVPAYLLVVDKAGLRAAPAAAGAAGGFRIRPGHVESESGTMAGLADKLSRQCDRPVVDATNVAGSYRFMLDWTPEPAGNVPVGDGISLYTAIEQQLGLKLEARKAPMEVVVIDRIEKVPTAN